MPRRDPELPTVFTRQDAFGAELTHQQIARRVRTGRWRRLQAGVYCHQDSWRGGDRRARHLLRAEAVVRAGGGCVSHASAAAWHGLPLPWGDPSVWVTRAPGSPTRYRDGVHVLAASVPSGEVITSGGMAVTSLARTVADCLRHLQRADAVAVGDAALRLDPGLRTDLDRVLGSCGQWPYVARARHRINLLDGCRESPLESMSFVEMVRCGVPLPSCQVEVRGPDGAFVGRVDFWWPGHAVAGEADGAMKYDVTGRTAESARQTLLAEKRREDRLRSLGIRVVRWGAADVVAPGFGRWLAGEIALGNPDGFRGTARPSAASGAPGGLTYRPGSGEGLVAAAAERA